MRKLYCGARLLVPVILVLTFVDVAMADGPSVTVESIPPTVPTTFPPDQKPPDIKPNEDAVTTLAVRVDGGAYTFTFDGTNLKITSVGNVTVSGQISVELPTNADPTLKDHEQGHQDLDRAKYNEIAKKEVDAAFRDFNGETFKGVGSTPAERQKSAEDQAATELQKRVNRAKDAILNKTGTYDDKYDKLTAHGTNGTNSKDGKAATVKELALAPPAGSGSGLPDPAYANASNGASSHVTYDSTTDSLVLSLSALSHTSGGPFDPILGSSIQVSPFSLIGVLDNGAFSLGDSQLSISQGFDQLVFGYLTEVAYTPTSVPGYAGLISGYLDIPPASTGSGIQNDVGSPFLSSYQSAFDDSLTAGRSSFWFYTNQALFDSSGNVISTDSAGSFEIGIATPEPSTILSAVIAALISLALVRLGRRERLYR